MRNIPQDRVNFCPGQVKQQNKQDKKEPRNIIERRETKQSSSEKPRDKESKDTKKGININRMASEVPKKANTGNRNEKMSLPNSRKKTGAISKRRARASHNKTYESHPNMSGLKRQGKTHKDSFITSDSEWESDLPTKRSEKNVEHPVDPKKPNGPQRVEKSYHITNSGKDVEEVIKEKTVCEDGI